MYPPLTPALLLILFFVLHLLNKKIVTRIFLAYYSFIVLIIIAINYCIKLVV